MDENTKRLMTFEALLTNNILSAMQMGGVVLEDAEKVLKDLVEVSVLLSKERLFDRLQGKTIQARAEEDGK